MDIEQLLTQPEKILAHIGGGKDETLTEHTDLVMSFVRQLQEENGLQEVVKKTIHSLTFNGEYLTLEEYNTIEKWFYAAISLHDLGKINPAFQKVKMKQPLDLEGAMMTKHSLLSSLLYLNEFGHEIEEQEDEEKQSFFAYILLVFSYLISRHHTYLKNFSLKDYASDLDLLVKRLQKNEMYLQFYRDKTVYYDYFDLEEYTAEENIDDESHNHYSFYTLTRLLYSTLVATDFYATYTYDKNGERPRFRYLQSEDVTILRKTYNDTQVVQGIEAYKCNPNFFEKVPINQLRSDLYIEAERQIIEHQNESLFYLEAPTGAGKTNMSINLALTLLEQQPKLNKVLYIFPFNTLIEQTKKELDKIFPQELQQKYPMAVVNSVTPIVHEKEKQLEEEYVDVSEKTGRSFFDYKEEVLYRQMLQYPITLTSHVNFFNYLFGVGRESNLAFTHLCNSVVIIDEIQGYRNARWMEMIEFLTKFAELLNMKIIIMSATLPKLDRLLPEKRNVIELLPNAKDYFAHPLFKERVTFRYDLLTKDKITAELLVDEIIAKRKELGPKRILIECIRLKSSEEVYQLLKERLGEKDIPMIRLNGNHHAHYRKKVIDALGKNEDGTFKLDDVMMITTQVIEAGVDIDMDLGFKDIATLDSEEQFAGRINRSCLRTDCYVYFFNMIDAKHVYRGDFRLPFNVLEEKYRLHLENKEFDCFYESVFGEVKRDKRQLNENHIAKFYQQVHQLQYEEVAAHMRLIDDHKYNVFLAYDTEREDGTPLRGREVWQRFVDLTLDRKMSFAERRVKLSLLSEDMSYFLFSTYTKPVIQDQDEEKSIGEIYYIEHGEHFVEEDPFTGMMVFNEDKLKKQGDDLFL
ncbi:CRISPR-associated helicase Cas3' [Hazenella coriacea]|uniref:CRISPR-associated endonuclease/helicase Cas3 n=1 Tax=Hazenella coriacea TaxID=1179467 RepID=A0A4R3L581_9BACL|nr:CRISPR-associated helicase Cas3' [Hazenella coriacea]TCS94951.1 CRISPR-associated endonuclease/helicase Cas3 [Hazenella coriacea]